MAVDIEAKYSELKGYDYEPLDLSQLDLEIDVEHIEQYENEQYAILRKHGLGTSDSSIVCGVNPYKTKADLLAEKSRDFLTQEEKEVGDKTAVKKGRDLEPVIIKKHSEILNKRILKPSDMYKHKDFPWLKFNFDGVIDKMDMGNGKYLYIPDEIKVVTQYGQKHYDRTKCFFRESLGFVGAQNVDIAKSNNSIETKAALYGIPPYYYTQLQQQIFGLNAPFGYLTVLFDSDWELVSFFVARDDATITQIITEGDKLWHKICMKTGDMNRADVSKLLKKYSGTPEVQKKKGAFTVYDA